jgi:hypothetical protein
VISAENTDTVNARNLVATVEVPAGTPVNPPSNFTYGPASGTAAADNGTIPFQVVAGPFALGVTVDVEVIVSSGGSAITLTANGSSISVQEIAPVSG